MNGKWTPGPWHMADNVRGNGERLIRDSRIPPQLIATVVESDREYRAGSNAQLIVNAPMLAVMLARARQRFEMVLTARERGFDIHYAEGLAETAMEAIDAALSEIGWEA